MGQERRKIATPSGPNLLDVVRKVKPSSYSDYRVYLNSLFLFMQEGQEDYSYEQFSRSLGFAGKNELLTVLRSQRQLTLKEVERIALKLYLPHREYQFLAKLVEYATATDLKKKVQTFHDLLTLKGKFPKQDLESDQETYFSQWYYPVIGELAKIEGLKLDPKWIAKAVIPGLSEMDVARSLKLLQGIGILAEIPGTGELVRSERDLSTGDEVGNSNTIKDYHRQLIELGKESLDRTPQVEREISSVTLSVNEDLFKKIKLMIQEFENRALAEEAQIKNPNQIYQLNVQFFPVSKKVKR